MTCICERVGYICVALNPITQMKKPPKTPLLPKFKVYFRQRFESGRLYEEGQWEIVRAQDPKHAQLAVILHMKGKRIKIEGVEAAAKNSTTTI